MATYVAPIVCDALANFTSNTTTGTGSQDIDTDYQQEGTGCLFNLTTAGAGTAWSTKTLTTPIASGAYFRLKALTWFARNAIGDAPPYTALDNAGTIQGIRLYQSVNLKALTLFVRPEASATLGRKWQVATDAGTYAYKIFDPGWTKGVWREIRIFGYVHDTAGWIQVWDGATKWAEVTGIDTYPGAAWNRIDVGIYSRSNTNDQICFAWDYIECDDTASPAPPGQRVRGKVNSCLAGVGSRGGIITGVQAMLEYEKIRRAA